jgi:hypothetical protein
VCVCVCVCGGSPTLPLKLKAKTAQEGCLGSHSFPNLFDELTAFASGGVELPIGAAPRPGAVIGGNL